MGGKNKGWIKGNIMGISQEVSIRVLSEETMIQNCKKIQFLVVMDRQLVDRNKSKRMSGWEGQNLFICWNNSS